MKQVLLFACIILNLNGLSVPLQRDSGIPDTAQVKYILYLIGDAGEPSVDGPDSVFELLKRQMKSNPKESAVVFLGDNIYPSGLPDSERYPKKRKEAEAKINVQLDAVEKFGGDIYFIAGNHDWNKGKKGGLAQIQRQEVYVEDRLDRGNVFLPNAGCPGPVLRKLGKDVALIFIDSQWFLHPHDKEDTVRNDCSVENAFEFKEKLEELIEENDDKQIVVLAHHPIFSHGEHGGYYTLKDHLFPLSNLKKWLYLPLPGLGSLYPFYRSSFGHVQDLPNPVNIDYQDLILNSLFLQQNIVVISGHEHNMQHIFHHGNHFIISGSGSKNTSVKKGKNSLFAASKKGFGKLMVYDDGSVRFEFHAVGEGVIYSTQLRDKKLKAPKKLEPYELDIKDTTLVASDLYATSGLQQFFFGKHYREEWSEPIKVRTLNLSKEKGGLRPIKKGGGFASLSLRLEANNEEQYVLRSVDKNVSKVVPEQLRNTVAQTVIQDQIAASHPYGALAVPKLAQAAGVYHTNPEMVFLPSQEALGDYNQDFANKMFLFEERPAGNLKEKDNFGNSKKIIGYDQVLELIRENSDSRVNQWQALRSRLFDIFLGDWDRHDDQWRWASFEEEDPYEKGGKIKIFEPIPRDRDQVFYIYRGLIPWITKQAPSLKKFQSFDEDIKNVIALNFNGKHFDRSFLTQMDRSDWQEIAEELKIKLTEEVIEQAIFDLPPEIFKIRGDDIIKKLKARRDKLSNYAEEYYLYLAKYVDVVGTDKREFFAVQRTNDNTTSVVVHKLTKNDKKEDLIYSRTFYPDETKEIRLYGLDDDDVFSIGGKQNEGIIIRVIGGNGNDIIEDQSTVKGSRKKTIIYDSLEGNEIHLGAETKDLRSDDPVSNSYNRQEFYYNTSLWIPFLSFNSDDGLILNTMLTQTKYGFRKYPYRFKHNISLGFTSSTQEFAGQYSMEMLDVFGKADFSLNANLYIPNDINNFFGLGNETVYDQNIDINFYRYKQYSATLFPGLQFKSKHGIHNLKIGPFYEFRKLKSEQESFTNQFELSGLNAEDFEENHLTGLTFHYNMERVDNFINPNLGMRVEFDPKYYINLSDGGKDFFRLSGSMSLFNFIQLPDPFVWATKIEGAINFGDYEFYQANYLGKDEGLRAFRKNRFGGKASFSFSNDLRIRLFGSKNYVMPFDFGILGSYDIGRVWNRNNSDLWHKAFGGGIWFSPFLVTVISISYMTSDEDSSLLNLNFGFDF